MSIVVEALTDILVDVLVDVEVMAPVLVDVEFEVLMLVLVLVLVLVDVDVDGVVNRFVENEVLVDISSGAIEVKIEVDVLYELDGKLLLLDDMLWLVDDVGGTRNRYINLVEQSHFDVLSRAAASALRQFDGAACIATMRVSSDKVQKTASPPPNVKLLPVRDTSLPISSKAHPPLTTD